MEHIIPPRKNLSDYLAIARRRWVQFIIVFVVLISISVVTTIVWPPEYKSSAIILIEQQEIPQDLVRSTVTSFADQRIQTISQRVMTTANLLKIIDKYELYVDERKKEPREVIINMMRDDISLDVISADVVDPRSGRPTPATIAFTVAYRNKAPNLAQKVANELVSLYLKENLETRAQMAEETSGFLTDESKKLSVQIADLEKLLSDFKTKNADSLPEVFELNWKLLDRTELEILNLERELKSLKERDIFLTAELARLPAYTDAIDESGRRVPSSTDRLKQLELTLASKSGVYAENHPDMLRMRSEVSALRKALGLSTLAPNQIIEKIDSLTVKREALLEKYASDHPDIRMLDNQIAGLQSRQNQTEFAAFQDMNSPDNPAYIQINSQLKANTQNLVSAKNQIRKLKQRRSDLEDAMTKAPLVEKEYRSLMRNYNNSLAKFQEVKAKEMEAKLAESLELEKKSERFTLIEPPMLPEKPVSPNRIALLMLGFIASIGGGAVTAGAFEGMDKSVYGEQHIKTATGIEPLISVPFIETEENKRKKLIATLGVVIGTVVLAILCLWLVNTFYKPLDVLWFIAMRKIGF